MSMYEVIEKDDLGQWIEYEIPGKTIHLKLKYISDMEYDKMVQKSTVTKWKRGVKTETLKDDEFTQRLLQEAFLDIKNIKVKELDFLLEPKFRLKITSGDGEKDAKFNDDLLQLLIKYGHREIKQFVLEKSRDLSEFHNQEEKEEIENLSSGSGMSKARKNSQESN